MKRELLRGIVIAQAMLFGLQQPILARDCERPCSRKTKWDYIIVGGGTSASQLAKILTDDFKTSVLMIEAGPNYDGDIRVEKPAPYANQLSGKYETIYDYQQVSIYQQFANNNTYPYINGRMLGGSSSHNGLQYTWPTTAVMNEWDAAAGSTGLWGPDNTINGTGSAMVELENYNGTTNPDGNVRGRNMGPFHPQVRQAPADVQPPVNDVVAIIDGSAGANSLATAGQQLMDYPNDFNDPAEPIGVCPQWQLWENWTDTAPTDTLHERQSASIVFLDPIINASSGKGLNGRKLQVLTNATVNKILFDGQTASGVSFTDNKGNGQEAFAKQEIIVSAGAFSCEVLMRSGIGNYSRPELFTNPAQAPWALLSASNIPQVFDNPNVGQHLQNHPLVTAAVVTTPTSAEFPNGAPLLPLDDLDALYVVAANFPAVPGGTNRNIVIDFSIGGGLPAVPANANRALILPILLTPVSEGSVVIRSQNLNTTSIEDPNLFGDTQGTGDPSTSQDFNILYNFMQGIGSPNAISAANGPMYNILLALKNLGWNILTPLTTFQSTDALTAYIKASVFHAFHYARTCQMGTAPSNSVVDYQGRVWGVNRLRVLDVSIAPVIPDSNTGSVAFMIAKIMGPLIASGASLPFTTY